MKPLPAILASLKDHVILSGGHEGEDGIACRLSCDGIWLTVIASWGLGWDHVSVSLETRVPTWNEMCFVKDFFFNPNECAVQYHPPDKDYVNNHPYVLHLWRPQDTEIPMPPKKFV